MTGFSTNKLKIETADGLNVNLFEGFSFTRKDGVKVDFPAGEKSQSDGASTPRPLWIDLPPFGPYWMAAVGHDGLYRGWATVAGLLCPKEFADETFLEMMECLGVPDVDRIRLYEGVHLLGWHSFNEDRKE